MKDNWIDFINNGKNCSKSIVQSISFHDEINIRNLISENRSRGECFLERVESIIIRGVELPGNILPGETCQ